MDYEVNDVRTWPVHSDCESVRMISTFFETEQWYDYVEMGDIKYNGTIEIDTVLPTNFTVTFYSDEMETAKGFVLQWDCI